MSFFLKRQISTFRVPRANLVEHAEAFYGALKFLMDVFLNLQEQHRIFHVALLRYLI